MNARRWLMLAVLMLCCGAAPPATAPAEKKQTLAVLPFTGGDEKEKALAERMRFAVSQKLSNDAQWAGKTGKFNRMDNVQVEQTISALQLPWAAGVSDDDLQKAISTIGADVTIAGNIQGRKLTLTYYTGTGVTSTASVEIPPDRESPKLAVEKVLTDLTGAAFAHIREVEADHSDPAAEKRFHDRANLVADPSFEDAGENTGANWHLILGATDDPVPLIGADAAPSLTVDKAAVIPVAAAGVPTDATGHCLMMRLSKFVAENNGLAVVSTWIPVEQGKKYRFTARYHSTGPVARIFLKGFAVNPDKFGDKNDPEAVRREYYRAQVLPREKNKGWDLIEMDFTPESLKKTDPPIQWVRIDFWTYLHPGDIYFDDVVCKKISE